MLIVKELKVKGLKVKGLKSSTFVMVTVLQTQLTLVYIEQAKSVLDSTVEMINTKTFSHESTKS